MSDPIIIDAWHEMRHNSLLGFATVRFPSGMIVADVTLHQTNGKFWASPPSKPMLGRDGMALRDAESGKVRYSPIITFSSKEIRDRWSDQVIAAIRAAHPEVLS